MKKILLLPVLFVIGACSSAPAAPPSTPTEVVLLTHDSFAMSKEVLADFERDTGYDVKIVQNGDTGQLVNAAVLSAGAPQADVLFGVDNTFLSRAQQAGVFSDYTAPNAPADLVQPGVTPIDTGAVCLNYDVDFFVDKQPPRTPADLVKPEFKDLTVVQNPATSSPGLAFLLSTIVSQPDWQQYWQELKDNGVKVVDSWENAYYQQFSGGSGEGTRPIVVSYSTSPAAESMFSKDPGSAPPTVNVDSDCFQQVEYAGVLTGAANPQGAKALIDFMLSPEFQNQVGEQMFVYPVMPDARVPAAFTKYSAPPTDPVVVNPEAIAQNRDEWIDQWSSIMGQ